MWQFVASSVTTRTFSHSSADSNVLDNGPTCSLLLSPTMIWLNLPPPILRDFLGPPTILLRRRLALIFTSLLVLLAKDNSNDSKVLGEQQSQFTRYQRRTVGLSEKERKSSMRSQSGYYGHSPVQWNATVPQLRSPLLPRPVSTSAQCF